jgi:WD40 repeat protein
MVILCTGVGASAAESPISVEAMRLLKKNCVSCHNDEKKKGDLTLTSREAMLQGGDSGAAVVSGKPEESLLIESLQAGADPHMPPKKQLSEDHVAVLKRWVQEGAEWNADALAGPASDPREVSLAPLPGSYHPVLALALSPDATRLAVGCGNQVIIYNVAAPDVALIARASAHPDPVQSVAWSPDGKRLATGAFRRVVIWNPEALAAERVINSGLTDRIAALRFLPDGKQLVIADGRIAEEGTLRIADCDSGNITKSWAAHRDTIFDIAVSGDGKMLATAGGDHLVKIWDVGTQAEKAKLEGHVSQVLTVSFHPANAQLLSGGADQQLKVWDVNTRERIMTLGKHSAAINAATWEAGGAAVLAVTDTGALFRYTDLQAITGVQSSTSGKERTLEAAAVALYCVTAAGKDERIYAGSDDGRLFVWNKDGKLTAKVDVNESRITASAAQ